MRIDNKQYFFISGYGWSGSSAVVDLLSEVEGVFNPNIEFRLIKDRFGVIDLENVVTNQIDPIETDLAVKDFLWLAKSLSRVPRKVFSLSGMGYERYFGNEFYVKTEKFINDITTYTYDNFWTYFSLKWNLHCRTLSRLKTRVLHKDINEKCYFIREMAEHEFENKVKEYLNSLFVPIMEKEGADNILLDQGIPANKPDYAFKYCNNAKIIIVDRDPRDIYVDLVKSKQLLGNDLLREDSAKKFIDWHKVCHNKYDGKNADKILYIRFEDLILDYEKIKNSIFDFMGLDMKNHINKSTLFNPDISRKNVGIWKEYPNQDVMAEIGKQLRGYCYD